MSNFMESQKFDEHGFPIKPRRSNDAPVTRRGMIERRKSSDSLDVGPSKSRRSSSDRNVDEKSERQSLVMHEVKERRSSLGATCTRRPLTRRIGSGSRSNGSGLDTSTSATATVTTTSKRSSRVRGNSNGISRHRSSDNMENVFRSNDGGLGAATLHGKSTVSRIRSARETGSSRPAKLSASKASRGESSTHEQPRSSSTGRDQRRSTIKRAMSRDNVMRPEEYAQANNKNSKNSKSSRESSSSQYGGDNSDVRRGRRRPKKEEFVEVVEESEDCETSDDSDVDSFAAELDSDTDQNYSKPKQQQQQQQQQQHKHQRRDLLVLLREQKNIAPQDFEGRDNRRILHFLMFQHRMDVDLAELRETVEHDISTKGVDEAMRPQPPPLFVEMS